MDFKGIGESLLAAQRAADKGMTADELREWAERAPADLAASGRKIVGLDLALGNDISVYDCTCGFRTTDKAAMVTHLYEHATPTPPFDYDLHDDPRR